MPDAPLRSPAHLFRLLKSRTRNGLHVREPGGLRIPMSNSIEIVHRAIDLSDDGDYHAALNLLTYAISLDSNNAQAYFERGMVFLNLNQDAIAVADFDRALAIDP